MSQLKKSLFAAYNGFADKRISRRRAGLPADSPVGTPLSSFIHSVSLTWNEIRFTNDGLSFPPFAPLLIGHQLLRSLIRRARARMEVVGNFLENCYKAQQGIDLLEPCRICGHTRTE